jgi:AcrR family transcriptional regulator
LALIDAAAAVFLTSGVQTPLRDIAARAGVGVGTIYRHFPTRANLIVAVCRREVEACADGASELQRTCRTPYLALSQWINMFVNFLFTKQGLAAMLNSDDADFDSVRSYFVERLVPVCAELLHGVARTGEIRPDVGAYELMQGVASLCIGVDHDSGYDARRMVQLLITGLHQKPS